MAYFEQMSCYFIFMMKIFMKSRNFVKSFASLFAQVLIFSGTIENSRSQKKISSIPLQERGKKCVSG